MSFSFANPDTFILPALSQRQLNDTPYQQPRMETSRAKQRSYERVRHLINTLPIATKIESFLDLGAGNCEITEEISQHYGCSVAYGCDVYPETQFVRPSKFSNVTYTQLINDRFTIADNSVDLVTAFMSIHHIPQFDIFLTEIRRILKPGGWFFIREHDVTTSQLALYLDQIHEGYATQNGYDPRNHMVTKARYWSRYELAQTIIGGGFVHIGNSEYNSNNRQAVYHTLFQIQK